jgi:integrase
MGIQSLTRDEILELLAEAKRHSNRDWLMILVSFMHGLRASEITRLTPRHLAGGFLTIQRLKGSLKTTHPLVTDENELVNERAAIEEFKFGMHLGERLFPICRQTFWRAIQRYAKAVDLPPHKRNTKMLKHSIAMQTIRLAGIENVRAYLGHKSLASTGAYLRVNDEDASAAMAKALKT